MLNPQWLKVRQYQEDDKDQVCDCEEKEETCCKMRKGRNILKVEHNEHTFKVKK